MPGNSRRRFFRGPGLNNFDRAILKGTKMTGAKDIQFRAEAFNIFKHAQFHNPGGELNSSSFGVVTPGESCSHHADRSKVPVLSRHVRSS